jgi:hypothetical protein
MTIKSSTNQCTHTYPPHPKNYTPDATRQTHPSTTTRRNQKTECMDNTRLNQLVRQRSQCETLTASTKAVQICLHIASKPHRHSTQTNQPTTAQSSTNACTRTNPCTNLHIPHKPTSTDKQITRRKVRPLKIHLPGLRFQFRVRQEQPGASFVAHP